MIYTIHTRLSRIGWHCFGTIEGYDISFKGMDAKDAQRQMKKYLKQRKIKSTQTKWLPIEVIEFYEKKEINPPIVFQRTRLDDNMV